MGEGMAVNPSLSFIASGFRGEFHLVKANPYPTFSIFAKQRPTRMPCVSKMIDLHLSASESRRRSLYAARIGAYGDFDRALLYVG